MRGNSYRSSGNDSTQWACNWDRKTRHWLPLMVDGDYALDFCLVKDFKDHGYSIFNKLSLNGGDWWLRKKSPYCFDYLFLLIDWACAYSDTYYTYWYCMDFSSYIIINIMTVYIICQKSIKHSECPYQRDNWDFNNHRYTNIQALTFGLDMVLTQRIDYRESYRDRSAHKILVQNFEHSQTCMYQLWCIVY